MVKTLLGTNIYYYQDELGSTSHVASASGALLEYYKYNLYGTPTYWSSTSQQLTSSTYGVVDLGNGGARWISDLALYDDRNRFMSPALGRFIQPDPIGFKGDASNLYRYCGNDWANKTDLMGLDAASAGVDPVETVQLRNTTQDKLGAQKFQQLRQSFQKAVTAFNESARKDAGKVNPKEAGQKGFADAQEDERKAVVREDRDGRRYAKENITGEFAKGGKLTKVGPNEGKEYSIGSREQTAEEPKPPPGFSPKSHAFILTHDHGPGSLYGHQFNDVPNALGKVTGTPFISFVASTADNGKTVQAFVPAPGLQRGFYFHSTDGITWTPGP